MRTGTKEKFYIRWILAALCVLAFSIISATGCGRISSAIHWEEDAYQAAAPETTEDPDRSVTESGVNKEVGENSEAAKESEPDAPEDSAVADNPSGNNLSPEGFIYIHVCGEVKKPGLYRIAAGSRAGDALELAGGFTGKADRVAVNLAAPLEDGQQIYVPNRSETDGNKSFAGSDSTTESGSTAGSGSSARPGSTAGLGSSARPGSTAGSDSTVGSCSSAESGSSADSDSASAGKVNINTAGMEELVTLQGIGESRAAAILDYRRKNGNFSSISDIRNVSGIGEGIYSRIKDSITV